MTALQNCEFICLDVESTGLDPNLDRIIEIGCILFTLNGTQDEFETLVNPLRDIPQSSTDIHNITNEMIQNQPLISDVLPTLLQFIGKRTIIGHSIGFDINMVLKEAERNSIPTTINHNKSIDTLRLARLYGESPSNSLEVLRQHFSIEAEGAHRAKSDVLVNIQVFQRLIQGFKTMDEIEKALEKPILMKIMPLGKHRGRPLKDIPLDYLLWASRQSFDQDLAHSLRHEIQKRKRGGGFLQSVNPFQSL